MSRLPPNAQVLNVRVSEPLLSRLREYHRTSGLEGTEQDTARALIEAMLNAPEIESSLLQEARRRAFNQVRSFIINDLRAHLSMMERDLQSHFAAKENK